MLQGAVSGIKEQQREISDRIVSVIEADIHGLHGLHEHDPVAFYRGNPFVRMAAGRVRIGTGLALHAAGRKSQHIAKLLTEAFTKFESQVFMLPSGFQAGFKIQAVFHLGNGGKKKGTGIFFTFPDAALDGTDSWRAGPGMTVMLTFMLTDKTDFFRKDQILPVQILKFQDRIIVNKRFNGLFI